MCNITSRILQLLFFHQSFCFYSLFVLPCNIKVSFYARHDRTIPCYFSLFISFLRYLMFCVVWFFVHRGFISGTERRVKNPFSFRKLNEKLKNSTGRTREQQQSGLNILNELKCKNQSGTRSNHISKQQRTSESFGFFLRDFVFCSCVRDVNNSRKKIFSNQRSIKPLTLYNGCEEEAIGRSQSPQHYVERQNMLRSTRSIKA